MHFVKKILKLILPVNYINFLKSYKLKFYIAYAYYYDFKRFCRFSSSRGCNNEIHLISKIILQTHVVEKGLTMPQTRLGFGKENIIALCINCIDFLKKYNDSDVQLTHAVKVIEEYKQFHLEYKFKLDLQITEIIRKLEIMFLEESMESSMQIDKTRIEYFGYTNDSFASFSNSRFTVRNFSQQDIPIETIKNALSLATNTPSSCNRQSWRTYIYTNKEQIENILTIQGGNRGFGHLSNKLIIISAELGVYGNLSERYEAYVDGGIYAMNLLYSLHYYQIGACILNCGHNVEKDKKLRNICEIKESEVFIAMIACGIPPDSFKVPISRRYDYEKTNIIY